MAELEIVLILRFDQLADLNMALNAILVESLLQHFVILDKFVLMLSIPFHFAEVKSSGVQAIKHGAIHRTCCTLFNLCQLQLYKSQLDNSINKHALTSSNSLNHCKMTTLPTK